MFYTKQAPQNKQTVTSKDTTKDRQLLEKFCYFKNGLTCTNENSKTIFFSFKKNYEISFVPLRKLYTESVVLKKSEIKISAILYFLSWSKKI